MNDLKFGGLKRFISIIVRVHSRESYMSKNGAEEMTQYQVAEILSEESGRKINYIPMEIEPFGEMLKQ